MFMNISIAAVSHSVLKIRASAAFPGSDCHLAWLFQLFRCESRLSLLLHLALFQLFRCESLLSLPLCLTLGGVYLVLDVSLAVSLML